MLPLPNAQGALPAAAIWPADFNRTTLRGLTSARINLLLAFYGLNMQGNVGARRDRLAVHLGAPAFD